MARVDREGTFRGQPVDWAVGETKNGFPQFNVKLLAAEYYDPQENEWVPWEEYEQEITAYMVLFDSTDKKTLNCQQIEKVFGWDGSSFAELNDGVYNDVKLQFRVKEEEYQGKTSLQVSWIDTYDADPNPGLRKLDPKEVKKLDSKFSRFLTKKAAKAAKEAPKPPAKSEPKTEKAEKPTPPKKSKPPAPPKAAPKQEEAIAGITREEAWDLCVNNKLPNVGDDELTASWLRTVKTIANGRDEDELTGEDWASVRDTVLAEVGGQLPF